MLGSAGSPSAGGAPGRQPPGRGLGTGCQEGLWQGPASHWWLLSCHWLQPPLWRLGQRSQTEGSRGTHGVGQVTVSQVEQRGGGSEEEEGFLTPVTGQWAGSGGWWRGGRGGDKVGVRRSCPPQPCLVNTVNHRRSGPSAGADRWVDAGFVISPPLVPSPLHFPPWMGLDTFPPSSHLSQNFRMGLYLEMGS